MSPCTTYTDQLPPDLFALSRFYQSIVPASRMEIREFDGRRRLFPYSERHLQCLWADPALRPDQVWTSAGESVLIENPGTWNLEAGPDFTGAALRIGPDRRLLVGDVEIHVHARDWMHHGHAEDPRYAGVQAHISWFDDVLPSDVLPSGCRQIAMQPVLSAVSGFSFESIDVAQYPYGKRARIPPCSERMRTWDPDQKRHLLAAAGEERIRRKAERFAVRVRERGADQALYEELMAALGYKHNKRPFRQLAETLDWAALRKEAGGDSVTAYALLIGVAGLMPPRSGNRWDRETQRFVRRLWDIWWKRRTDWTDRMVPARAWRFDGIRPTNHPVRRLMAAAVWAGRDRGPADAFLCAARNGPDDGPAAVLRELTAVEDPYWSHRTGWNGRRTNRPIALIGLPRAVSIAVNVILPFLAGAGIPAGVIHHALKNLPGEPENGIIRQTAVHLFGPDHPPSFYSDPLRRQGLIQIFQDFCLNDRSQCASCPLPAALAALHR